MAVAAGQKPNTYKIAVIAGDGIGNEVVPEGIKVLEAVGRKFDIAFQWDTFDWSYELLDDRERRVLDRLGVFATPFDIGDATAVCVGDGISQTDVFEAVLALADKSLITSTRSTPS